MGHRHFRPAAYKTRHRMMLLHPPAPCRLQCRQEEVFSLHCSAIVGTGLGGHLYCMETLKGHFDYHYVGPLNGHYYWEGYTKDALFPSEGTITVLMPLREHKEGTITTCGTICLALFSGITIVMRVLKAAVGWHCWRGNRMGSLCRKDYTSLVF